MSSVQVSVVTIVAFRSTCINWKSILVWECLLFPCESVQKFWGKLLRKFCPDTSPYVPWLDVDICFKNYKDLIFPSGVGEANFVQQALSGE
jgi:hypothetical protein